MMDYKGIRRGWVFFKPVLIIALGAALATGVICWIIGWHTLSLYGTGLLIAGGAAVVVGALSTVGGWDLVRSFEYQFAKTAWEDNSGARLQKEVADTRESYRFLYLMSTAGLILISAGFLMDAVF